MKSLWFGMVLVWGGAAWGCIGPELTPDETLKLKNEVAARAMTAGRISVESVRRVRFPGWKPVFRGIRGDCSAIAVFGLQVELYHAGLPHGCRELFTYSEVKSESLPSAPEVKRGGVVCPSRL